MAQIVCSPPRECLVIVAARLQKAPAVVVVTRACRLLAAAHCRSQSYCGHPQRYVPDALFAWTLQQIVMNPRQRPHDLGKSHLEAVLEQSLAPRLQMLEA